MKKLTITIMTILVLALTACGSGASSTQQLDPSQSNNATATELPLASKLVIGSFKLEGTDNAITTEQAVELLPLWQVYQQLSTSDTAAQEEITALTEQIQETMTADQTKAIDAMNLTQQDIFTTMQDQGIQFGGQQTQGGESQQNGNNFGPPGGGEGFVRPDGGVPGAGPGGGGGGFNSGQNLSPEQIATAQARRSENGGGGFRLNGTPAPLIEALVKLLQEKAGS